MLCRRELVERAFPRPDCFFHDWWLASSRRKRRGNRVLRAKLVRYRNHGTNVTDILGERTNGRHQGYRWQQLREFRERLEHLARLPGGEPPFIGRCAIYGSRVKSNGFRSRLHASYIRHGSRLFALRKSGRYPVR